jgi:hypothetical protein
MAFKMRGMKFGKEGPVKPKSVVSAKPKAPKGDPTFEYGYEESEKIMKLRRKKLIPGIKRS